MRHATRWLASLFVGTIVGTLAMSVAPPSAPAQSSSLRVQYQPEVDNPNDQEIKPYFKILNPTGSAIPLQSLALRYYYSAEATPINYNCSYATVGCSNLTGQPKTVSPAASDGTNGYLEIGFAAGAGSIAANSDSGEIKVRLNAQNWAPLNETNDFSYRAGAAAGYADSSKVALFQNGVRVWGTEPAIGGGSISGRVTTRSSGSGIGLVTVCANPNLLTAACPYTATTDFTGNYRIDGLPEATYRVTTSIDNDVPSSGISIVGLSTSPTNFFVPTPVVWSKTEEVAHRGDVTGAPENSYESVKRAIEKGSSYLEIDVFLTADKQMVLAHGGNYYQKPPHAPSQVYGPTVACFDKSIELSTYDELKDCDIGSRGIPTYQTDYGKFKDERLPLLPEVLSRNSDYRGWMVEMKTTEIKSTSPAEKRARDAELGRKVNDALVTWMSQTGASTVWVTSFSDAALQAVTDPRIKKMRQVIQPGLGFPDYLGYPASGYINNGAVAEVDNAVLNNYDALNLDIGQPDDPIAPGAPTWEEYVHSRGLLLSVYRLDLRNSRALGVFPNAGANEQDTDDAIRQKADFYMTDFVEDLLIKNGDRTEKYPEKSIIFNPDDNKLVIENTEVFHIEVEVKSASVNANSNLVPRFFLEGETIAEIDFVQGVIKKTKTKYGPAPDFVVSYETSTVPFTTDELLNEGLRKSRTVYARAKHAYASNVQPKFQLLLAGINTYANEQPLRPAANPGIVGKNCIEGTAPAVAKGIALTGSLTAPDGFGVRSATLVLDGTVTVGTFAGSGALPLNLRLPSPALDRDIALGEHSLRITYVFENRSNSQQKLEGVENRAFTVKLKPCLKNKDIALVYDGSGSIASGDFDTMRDLGVRLIGGMEVSPTAANYGLVQFSNGAQVESPLSGDGPAVSQAVVSMSKLDSGTDTAAGITTAQTMLSAGRPAAPDVMIVLTDGVSNSRPATLAAATAAKAAGTQIIAVGIGPGVNRDELVAMASNAGYVFTTNDYDNLIYVLQALLPAKA